MRGKVRNRVPLKTSLDLLEQQGIQGDSATYASLLRGCGDAMLVMQGRRAHDLIIKSGFEGDVFLANLIVEMYGNCGAPEDARSVFCKISQRNVFSWTILIAIYVQQGQAKEVIHLFEQMQQEGVMPDDFTLSCVLSMCTLLGDLTQGQTVHASVVAAGFESRVVVGTAIVNMYGKCGDLDNASRVFGKMYEQNVVTWTAMITAYAQHGHCQEALRLFELLCLSDVEPNGFTFSVILDTCSSSADLAHGRVIHANAIAFGLDANVVVGTALVDTYGKCGNVEDARVAFNKLHQRNVVSWTAMIGACVQHGHNKEAFDVYQQMEQSGIQNDEFVYSTIIGACSSADDLPQGKLIHSNILEDRFDNNVFIGNAVIAMYANCGSLEDAKRVFDQMVQRNLVSWNALITSYTMHGHGKEVLGLFEQMQQEGIKPDRVTLIGVLGACATFAALTVGKRMHARIIDLQLESDNIVVTALINLYGKCGSLEDVKRTFAKLQQRDVAAWNAVIAAHADCGHAEKALQLVQQMELDGVEPDEITFVILLSACSHAGLMEAGSHYFMSMSEDHGVTPLVEHYGCMVDLLGRAGRLEEAEDVIKQMPLKPDVVVWETLLGACRMYGDVNRGKRAAEHILKLDPQRAAPYVLLSNIYAADGQLGEVERVWKAMADKGLKKQTARSWIEVSDKVHEFVTGDTTHPQKNVIYSEIERLFMQMMETGHMLEIEFILHDVEGELKENLLCFHSEKLAIAFGLTTTRPGTPLLVTKNLRVCGDCHSATKCISRIVGRQIILRDCSCIHKFDDGKCSCNDYW